MLQLKSFREDNASLVNCPSVRYHVGLGERQAMALAAKIKVSGKVKVKAKVNCITSLVQLLIR